jgi:MYXO-CTERM domain-containing protein
MALVLGPGETHGGFTAGSRAMVIELIEAYFNLRVPAEVDTSEKPVTLIDIDEKGGGYWLGDDYTKEIGSYNTFAKKDPLSHTSFLPTEALAMKWKAYGATLPAAIMLEKGKCSGCYKTPADEPEATPNNAGPGAGTPTPAADGGAPDPGAAPGTGGSSGASGGSSGSTGSGGSSGSNDPATPPPATMDASAPGTPPPSTSPPSSDPKPTPSGSGGSNATDSGPTTGGCSVGATSTSGGALLPLTLFGLFALLRGRRRRNS